MFRSIFTGLSMLAIVIGSLSACGGGGGDNDDSTLNFNPNYTGNRDPAALDIDNVLEFVANVLVGRTASDVLPVTVSRSSNTASTNPLPLDAPFRIEQLFRHHLNKFSPLQNAKNRSAARVDIDDTLACDSGFALVTGHIEDDSTGLLEFNHRNCRFGEQLVNGVLVIEINNFDLDDGIILNADFRFSSIQVSNTSGMQVLRGSMNVETILLSPARDVVTISGLSLTNQSSGDQVLLENVTSTYVPDSYFSPSTMTISTSGKLYDSRHGYVDFSTTKPLFYGDLFQTAPDSGEMRINTPSGETILIKVVNEEYIWFGLDSNGNGHFDHVHTLGIADLIADIDLADTDGDGMPDFWEIAFGLNHLSDADVGLDPDGDTYSNLKEYLGASNPKDILSVPPTTDLTIVIDSSGDPIIANTLDYLVQMTRSGSFLSEDAVVTITFPDEVIINGFDDISAGFPWECTQSGQTITCDYTFAEFSNTPAPITINVTLPNSQESLTVSTGVTTSSLETDLSDNVSNLVIDVLKRAPSFNLNLGTSIFDVELDRTRRRAYISLPEQNAVSIVSLDTMLEIDRRWVGASPFGIAMDTTGSKLYIALNDGGSIATLDLSTLDIANIDLTTTLKAGDVFDVLVPRSDELFATGGAGGTTASQAVRVDLANSNQATLIDGGNQIGGSPSTLSARNNPNYLYIASAGSVNLFRVNKYDLNQPSIPELQESPWPDIREAKTLSVAPDGTQLITNSGQVLDATSLAPVTEIDPGVSILSANNIHALAATSPNSLVFYARPSMNEVNRIYTACGLSDVERLIEVTPDVEWIFAGQQVLCRVLAPDSNLPVPQEADLDLQTTLNGDRLVGAEITYRLEVSNFGPIAANDVGLTIIQPASAAVVSAGGTDWICATVGLTTTCNLASLAFGAAQPVDLVATLPATPGNIDFQAFISAATTDANSANNDRNSTIEVSSIAASENLDLGAEIFDFEINSARQRIYVSVPSQNQVIVVSLVDLSVVTQIPVGTQPHGLVISPNGSHLFAALRTAGAVARVDLDTLTVDTIDVLATLGDNRTHDVFMSNDNDLYVSGNPDSNGFAYIVHVDLANADAATRVASDHIIRGAPLFADEANSQFMYVGETFRPNSLHKIDLGQVGAPLEFEQIGAGVVGADHISINAAGTRLLLTSGNILEADNFIQVGKVGSGLTRFSSNGTDAVVGQAPNQIAIYDLATMLETDRIYSSCGLTSPSRLVETLPDQQWIMLGQQHLCRITR